MTRTWPAILASAVAIAVLIALIYASRPLGTAAYERHYHLLSAIAATAERYDTLREYLAAGGHDQTSAGPTIATLRAGLEQHGLEVEAAARNAGTDNPSYSRFRSALAAVLADTELAQTQLEAARRAMSDLREHGAAAVQHLRDAADGPDADQFYSIWLKVLDYGRGGEVLPANLHAQLDEFNASDLPASPHLFDVTRAMDSVIAGRAPLETTLGRIRQARLAETAAALAAFYRAQHAASSKARNNARVLVSLYSLLLFAGLALVVFRLNASYRELNRANDRLQQANAELEDRVEARTRDVKKAYSDLQHSQVQLVHAEKMSSLGQLVAGISHEINTPLLYLHSNTTMNKEMLLRLEKFLDLSFRNLSPRRKANEPAPAARKRFIAGLKELRGALIDGEVREELSEALSLTEDNLEGLEELTRLAQGLKDFSRLDGTPVAEFDVNEGIQRTLTIARNMLKRHVRVTTDFGTIPPVRCAPSQINQVFLNLITNASQAIEETGEIAISTSVAGDYALIRIHDTGSGISPEIMHKVRDPFFTTKEVGSGTGLGLSIVDEILSKHNGRLEIESTLGEGSTFSVYLPIARPSRPVAHKLDDVTGAEALAATVPAALDPVPNAHSSAAGSDGPHAAATDAEDAGASADRVLAHDATES